MKKIFACITILFLSGHILAQKVTAIIEGKEKTTTLFDYGKPLVSTEANFRNLFKNFPLFVSNYGEGLKLISYKYLTVVKCTEQIEIYVNKNVEVYLCGGTVMSAFGGNDIENNQIRLVFPSEHQPKREIDKDLSKETKDELVKITRNINVGDEVYVVKFLAEGIKYNFYMFVNPQTKNVVKQGNFLGFSIPMYYADFCSKIKAE